MIIIYYKCNYINTIIVVIIILKKALTVEVCRFTCTIKVTVPYYSVDFGVKNV